MGIGGSGCSAAANLAKILGFTVSGCDLELSSSYLSQLEKSGISLVKGHHASHLNKADLLVVSPAVLAINKNHPEIQAAKKRKILITWQEFVGVYLQAGKKVIAVAGTHGKTTVTALVGLILEQLGLDPTVLVGGIVPQWQGNVRAGNSPYFVCEADEYNNNFLHYRPEIIVLNNIEMDHPEFFSSSEELIATFKKFIYQAVGSKILLVNSDDRQIRKILTEEKEKLNKLGYRVFAFRLGPRFDFPFEAEIKGKITFSDSNETRFRLTDKRNGKEVIINFSLKLPGRHNVYNALSALLVCRALNLNLAEAGKSLFAFEGVKRRLEAIGKVNDIWVIDDYGHHPTQIKATISAIKQKYPNSRLIAVFEPHQISRLRLMGSEFAISLASADLVIITEIFWGREKPTAAPELIELVLSLGKDKAVLIPKLSRVAEFISREARRGDVIVVFGAGKSSELAKLVLSKLGKSG